MTELTEVIENVRKTNSNYDVQQTIEGMVEDSKAETNIDTLLNEIGLETQRGGF